MKRKNSPTKPIGRLILPFVLAACALIPCSCKTTGAGAASPPPQGMASFDAVPKKEHRSRIGSSQIVALNGNRLRRPARKIVLRPGENRVTVRFDWPHGGTAETELTIPAVAERHYSLSYHPYPVDKIDGYTDARPFNHINPANLGADPLSAAFVTAYYSSAFALRAAEQTSKVAAYKARGVKDARKRADYTDIYVISSYQPEGIVSEKRVAHEATTPTG